MSHIIKALNKANREMNAHLSETTAKPENGPAESVHDEMVKPVRHSRSFDFHLLFMGILIVLVAVGVYLNYGISVNLSSTQDRMTLVSENFKSQQRQLDKLNQLLVGMQSSESGQSKEFLTRIDHLSTNVETQITEVKDLSNAHYAVLSKIIEEQQKKIEALTGKYDQLDHTVSNFTDVNSRYIEQLNTLKRKVEELKYKDAPAALSDNK